MQTGGTVSQIFLFSRYGGFSYDGHSHCVWMDLTTSKNFVATSRGHSLIIFPMVDAIMMLTVQKSKVPYVKFVRGQRHANAPPSASTLFDLVTM